MPQRRLDADPPYEELDFGNQLTMMIVPTLIDQHDVVVFSQSFEIIWRLTQPKIVVLVDERELPGPPGSMKNR